MCAKHGGGGGANGLDVASQLHPARLAAAAGMNLRLDHPDRAAERAGGGGGFVGAGGDLARRDRDSVAAEQLLGLIFVEIHRPPAARRARILLENARSCDTDRVPDAGEDARVARSSTARHPSCPEPRPAPPPHPSLRAISPGA